MEPGDIALATLLVFHGPAMNGGVLHAVECLSAEKLAAACAGFRYFGIPLVAALLEEAHRAIADNRDLEGLEQDYNERYWRDATAVALQRAFERDYAARPEHYAPVH